MKKRGRKLLAMTMAASMCVSSLGLTSFAAEPVVETHTDNGITTTVTTTTTATDSNAEMTVVVKIDKTSEGVTPDGVSVSGEEHSESTTVTDSEGNELKKEWETDGTETKEWTEQDSGNESGQPVVNVGIVFGGTNSADATSDPVTTDNKEGGSTDTSYDYTETTTTDRIVTASASNAQIKVNDASEGLAKDEADKLIGVAPEYDSTDNAEYKSDGKIKDSTGKDGLFDRNYLSGQKMDRLVIGDIIIWINDSNRTIANIYVPEGTTIPEDFNYEVGMKVDAWFTDANNKVQGNLQKAGVPSGATINNDVDISKIENWYKDGKLIVDIPEGADFMYVGTGEHSKYWVGFVQVIYEKDPETGETLRDENGNPIIKDILSSNGSNITINGEDATVLGEADFYNSYGGSRATNFMLMDQNGNRVFGYCCDIQTGTSEGVWYSFSNLEDSEYYASEESEEHIRSIIMNGYWGTSDIPDENGNYKTGSLESIKQKVKTAIENGEMPAVYETYLYSECTCACYVNGTKKFDCTTGGKLQYDTDGNPIKVQYNMLDILDELTEGEALCATQAAVWSFANGHQNALNGQDGCVVVDAASRSNFRPNSNENEPLDNKGNARVEFLYQWLMNLDTEEESTIVINEKNFVDDMGITVYDKAEGHANNTDDDPDNDVYNTDLNFKLAFIPGENDDLLVQITYTDLDGNPVNVVRRLAGENAEGQSYEMINPEADGSYVLRGLKLSENKDFEFDLRLEGTQYLEQGVYVYAPIGGRDVSQTFVGIAEGERNVDVSIGVTVSFDVDENNHVVAERTWHDEGSWEPSPTPDPDGGDNDPESSKPRQPQGGGHDPLIVLEDSETPLSAAPADNGIGVLGAVEILDDNIPLGVLPATGDASVVWMAFATLSALGMAGLSVTGKKREDEE